MQTVQSLLKLMFSSFPPPPGDDLAAQLEAYAIALDGRDLRDIEAAVHKLLRGEVPGHNPSFAPSPAMVGGAVRECMNARLDRDSRHVVRNQLPAPTVERTPESMARVKAKMDEAVAGLASQMLTPDVEAEKRRVAFQSRVQARFDPKSEREMAERLGYSVVTKDEDEGDWGGAAA